MAAPIGSLRAELSAGHAQFASDMKKAKNAVQSNASGMQRAMAKVGKSFSGVTGNLKALVSALAIGAAFRAVTNATKEQEAAIAQLEQTLKSTGRYTPELSSKLQGYAAELQKITTYGDETTIAMQALLLTFTKIGGDEFNRAQKVTLDVATALKTDLKSAALQVGKALNDPVLGMTALSRSGIQFSEAQKEAVKQLIATGDVAGAQKIVLKELETQFGGSAEAARNTLGGALSALKNAFGDLLEGDSKGGGVKGTTVAINELTDLLADPETVRNAQTLTNAMITGFGKVLESISTTVEFTRWLGEELAAQIYGVAGDDINRLEGSLDTAKKKLQELEDGYKAVGFADKLLGKIGISEGILDKLRGIKSAREEVAKLQKQVDDYYAFEEAKSKKRGTKTPAVTTPNVPVVTGGGAGEETEAEKALREKRLEAEAKFRDELEILKKDGIDRDLEVLKQGYEKELEAAKKLGADTTNLTEAYQLKKNDIIQKGEEEIIGQGIDNQLLLLEAEEKANEERLNKRAEFSDEYKKATLSDVEYELSKLQEQYDAYSGYITDKVALDEWYAASKKKILDKEKDDETGMLKELKTAIEGWGRDSTDAIVAFARTGEMSFSDMIDSMIDDLMRMFIQQQIMGPLFSSIGGFDFGSLFGSAKGNAFQNGNILPFAKGGIVTRPTVFPMAQGAGLMGEAGPEAIMPLTRIGGDLGVKSTGGGVEVNIINNVGADVSTSERTTADGQKAIDVYIDQAVAKKLGTFGSQSNKAMRQSFGARQRLTGR